METAEEKNERDIYLEFIKYSLAATVLCGLSFLVGNIGSVTAMFTVSPSIIFYKNNRNLPLALLMILLVACTLIVLFGARGGFFYTYEFGVLNAFLLIFLSRESDVVSIIFRSSVFAYFVIAVVVGSLAVIYRVNLHEAVSFMIDSSIDSIMEMYQKVDLPVDQVKALTDIYENLKLLFKKTYPALLFVGFEFIGALNIFVANRFFLTGDKKLDTERLLKWSPREGWIFGLIIFGFLYFVKMEMVNFIALNMVIVFLALYFFSGLIIVNHFFKTRKVPPFLQGVIYFMIVLLNEFRFVVIGIGVFDIWFDFRKLKKKQEIT